MVNEKLQSKTLNQIDSLAKLVDDNQAKHAGVDAEKLAYDISNELNDYTTSIYKKYSDVDNYDFIEDEEYIGFINDAESDIQEMLNLATGVSVEDENHKTNTDNDSVDDSTDDGIAIQDKIKDTNIFNQQLQDMVLIIDEAQADDTNDIPIELQEDVNEPEIDVTIMPIENIKGKLVIESIFENELISKRTFNVLLSGYVYEGGREFEALPFIEDYVLSNASYKIKEPVPKVVHFGSEDKVTIQVEYELAEIKKDEVAKTTVYRRVEFVDADTDEVITDIPFDLLTESYTFEGTYNEDGSINWNETTHYFDAIYAQEINEALSEYGYVKVGANIKQITADLRDNRKAYTETVRVKAIVDDVAEQKNTEPEYPTRLVRLVSHETGEDLESSLVQEFINGEWTPKLDINRDILKNSNYELIDEIENDDEYIIELKLLEFEDDTEENTTFVSLDDIEDIVAEMLSILPKSVNDDVYNAYETINDILVDTFKTSGYNKGSVARLNAKYEMRMLELINSFRTKLTLQPLSKLDNSHVSQQLFGITAQRSQGNFDNTTLSDAAVVYSNDINQVYVVGLGNKLTPEAIADFVFRSIMLEYDYLYDSDVWRKEHLMNLVHCDTELQFSGNIFVSSYDEGTTYKDEKGNDVELEQHTYRITIHDAFVKQFN